MSCILAIDGGGTRTRVGLYTAQGELQEETEIGPTNLAETAEVHVAGLIADAGRRLCKSTGEDIGTIAAGISGAGRTSKAAPMARALQTAFPGARVLVTSDALALFNANCDEERPVLVVAGTGSSVVARGEDGGPQLFGGLGPVLGDEGSAYRVAVEAVRAAQNDPELLEALTRAADIGAFNDFIGWLNLVPKDTVADLARAAIAAAENGNASAKNVLDDQAEKLAEQTASAIDTTGHGAQGEPLTVLTHGGLFENSPLYRRAFMEALDVQLGSAYVEPAPVTGHRAALQLALAEAPPAYVSVSDAADREALPSTESASVEFVRLDAMSPEHIATAMSTMEVLAAGGVLGSAATIGEAIAAGAEAIASGGRIIYVGAGTSGRLGVLDAAECPPTFGVSEDRVVALIAGGDEAVRHSVEGAEDNTEQAVVDLDALDPSESDFVVGISASGTAPYVLAALERARESGAATAVVACNAVPLDTADVVVILETGPEALPGSTRLKAGTATKMALNQISTGAMALAGYVFEGRMVGVRPVNAKLRKRCIRIVSELTGEDLGASEALLDETDGSIAEAVLMVRMGLGAEDARSQLAAANGILRKALESK